MFSDLFVVAFWKLGICAYDQGRYDAAFASI